MEKFNDKTECPFGQEHTGTELELVPENWLKWWHSRNDHWFISAQKHNKPLKAMTEYNQKRFRLMEYIEGTFDNLYT